MIYKAIHIVKYLFFQEYRKLYILKKKPRYIPGIVRINKKNYTYIDGPSFVAIYNEIFIKNKFFCNFKTALPTIIDCGANIGLTICYFKSKYPNAKIIAFEPDINCFNRIKKNIQNVERNNIQLINMALSNADGDTLFYSEGADAGRIKPINSLTPIMVQKTKLSRYINENIDFLKIDIEGEEISVLKEIEPTLHFVENLFIEYHSFSDTPQNLSEILNILERNKFRYYIEQNDLKSDYPYIEKNIYFGMDLLMNIFAVKEKNYNGKEE